MGGWPNDTHAGRGCKLGHLTICIALLSVVGCATKHAQYPDEWSALSSTTTDPAKVESQTCPSLVGRYVDYGVLAPDTPEELCRSATHEKFRIIGDWFCETSLGLNVAGIEGAGTWIDLQQPDADTLVVIPEDPTGEPVELHRSKGEFDCTVRGLTRTLRAPTTSLGYDEGRENTATQVWNVLSAVSNAFLATGGIQILKRSFSRASDGSLIMHVERSTRGLILGLPQDLEFSTYVSWAKEAAGPTLVEGVQGSPSMQIARVQPFRANLFATVWLVEISGPGSSPRDIGDPLSVGDLYSRTGTPFWNVTQTVEPGPHWSEWYSWSGKGARYGMTIDFEAGHIYSLAEAPEDCQSGSAKKGDESPLPLAWSTLLLEDTKYKGATARRRFRALCGWDTHRCQSDSECSGQQCVRDVASQWGFCGTVPVVAPPHPAP